uniref:glutathione S-transferase alpha-5-like isoform X5 n=1 Tax=Ciona intestinalis TaxID=7719 RepID=UPI000180B398|nr:glutathione S-transferase alpha-5-like isoform X5 [Ciona intestinalis]XP_026694457.1 glutathione S-transferase alpha-5-like isoform X4 [Ciona intestinalis]|eukprot:XP_009861494.1 glutathione S-transferase alpha-5-like isoform X5 [Ciona intestinalis]
MSKAVLHYLDGRGRAEKIRWMLAACGIDFDENFVTSKADFQQRIAEGLYLFKQVPLLEIDGLRIVQTGSILRYLGHKGGLMGENDTERALVDMYTEGIMDMSNVGLAYPFKPDKAQFWSENKEKLGTKYFSVYENILQTTNNGHLVENKQTMADVLLFESFVHYLDIDKDVLNNYPNLQAFMASMKEIPWVQKFLQPGSKRKDLPDKKYVALVDDIFHS